MAGVAVHEPWWDEAQAWLLARDASVGDLLSNDLAYEGHPPLWYLILMIPAKLGMPYKAINVTSALISIAGAAILLSLRSVPLLLRATIPFTFYSAYQYSVVSRSYVLIPPILFAIAALYAKRDERPVAFAALLALLSLVSVHGACLAAGLGLLFVIDLWRGRLDAKKITLSALAASALILTLAAVTLVVVLWPRADLVTGGEINLSFGASRLAGVAARAWTENVAPGLTIAPLLMAVLIAAWMWQRGVLLELVVLFAALLPISSMFFSRWHEGLFFWAIVFVLLLPARAERTPLLRIAGCTVMAGILALHCYWTARSLAYDIGSNFTGSRDAAAYIRTHGIDKTRLFGAGMRCLEVQPYFASNLFANYKTQGDKPFWNWSHANPWPYPNLEPNYAVMSRWLHAQLAARPDFFLASSGFRGEGSYAVTLRGRSDYREVARFSGGLFWKDRVLEHIDFALFQRVGR